MRSIATWTSRTTTACSLGDKPHLFQPTPTGHAQSAWTVDPAIQDWWGSAGFGGRRFDGTIPIFCLGLAAFLSWAVEVTRRHPAGIVTAMSAALVAWNLALMSAANDGIVE